MNTFLQAVTRCAAITITVSFIGLAAFDGFKTTLAYASVPNRSPSITGPATEYPINPGENGAIYGSAYEVPGNEPSGPAIKPKTYSWNRASKRTDSEQTSGSSL